MPNEPTVIPLAVCSGRGNIRDVEVPMPDWITICGSKLRLEVYGAGAHRKGRLVLDEVPLALLERIQSMTGMLAFEEAPRELTEVLREMRTLVQLMATPTILQGR